MATIYISSTSYDLKDFREKTIATLRKAGHDVVAMEDYVATGEHTPLQKCLDDVENCDYYVGIFAWRYGYVPSEGNPGQKSITELEYRKACDMNKPRFVFLLDAKVSWHQDFRDSFTGECASGAWIKALREELGRDKLTSFFKTPDDLSTLVVAAINNWEHEAPQREQQKYVESTSVEKITLNIQYIESLNTSLEFAQNMQNARTLSEEQSSRFKQLKRESYEIASLNHRVKELDRKAQALVSELRVQLDREVQQIRKEIALYGRENFDPKQIEAYERINTIVNDFTMEAERGKKVALWISNRYSELVKDSIQESLNFFHEEPSLIQRLEDPEQLSNLQREIEQYLRRVYFALILCRTNLLDDAKGLNQFPKKLYKKIFDYIKLRKIQSSSALSNTQKDLLIFYINHLVEHVFTEF